MVIRIAIHHTTTLVATLSRVMALPSNRYIDRGVSYLMHLVINLFLSLKEQEFCQPRYQFGVIFFDILEIHGCMGTMQ